MRLLATPIFLLCLQSLTATAATLYDASLGTLPAAQNWLTVAPAGSVGHDGTAVTLNTTSSDGDTGGFFSEDPFTGLISQHPSVPTLDPSAGYYVDFSLQVIAENHSARDDNGDGKFDRAGFSVISIGEDLRGIEIGFFDDRIWVYEDGQSDLGDLFTQAEFSLFDTTLLTDYRLVGDATGYHLFANNVDILSGDWRNYNPSGVSPLQNPYDNPSFLFFGDDTTSASSSVRLGDIAATVGAPVPLPAPIVLLLSGLCLLSRSRRTNTHP